MVLTRISDLVSIEAFGLKAELQKKIDEATVTIGQLQELAVAVAQPVVTNLGIQGHFVQLKYADRYSMRETINGLLSNIGIQIDTISSINSAFDQMFRGLLVKRMLGSITDADEDSSGRAEEMRSRNNAPMSGEIDAYFRQNDRLTDERKKYLEELKHFEDTGKLKTPTILDK